MNSCTKKKKKKRPRAKNRQVLCFSEAFQDIFGPKVAKPCAFRRLFEIFSVQKSPSPELFGGFSRYFRSKSRQVLCFSEAFRDIFGPKVAKSCAFRRLFVIFSVQKSPSPVLFGGFSRYFRSKSRQVLSFSEAFRDIFGPKVAKL